ncbi:hypothetical protein [Spirillospora albida]|uniref:hypothetical protein n=1 Tax=Spirillospora albida TaxID=58123 RepID=UPI001FDF6042|nr:hypothetical protein [Spirillospora albida]
MASHEKDRTRDARPPGTGRATTRRREPPVFELGRGWRKTVLVAHVVSAGAWIGIDVIVAVLVLSGRFATTDAVRGLAYQALATFVVWPMLASALVCLATGLVLGLGTRWGLLRYWWVAVKLVLNLVLCVLIVLALQPGMDEVGAYGRDLPAGAAAPPTIDNLFFPPAVSLTALTFATVLAVAKPWGRLRRDRSGSTRR